MVAFPRPTSSTTESSKAAAQSPIILWKFRHCPDNPCSYLAALPEAEQSEDLVDMRANRTRLDAQFDCDLLVGQSIRNEPGDFPLPLGKSVNSDGHQDTAPPCPHADPARRIADSLPVCRALRARQVNFMQTWHLAPGNTEPFWTANTRRLLLRQYPRAGPAVSGMQERWRQTSRVLG